MSEFDAYAEDYQAALQQGIAVSGESAEYFARGRITWLARCLRQLGCHAVDSVLDFGCGTGTATPCLLEVLDAGSVIGIDLSERSLEVARQTYSHLPATFARVAEYQPDGTVDLAYCNGVFHHVPPADRQELFALIARSLRPGGLFALWENNPWSPAARYVMSRIPFDRDAIMVWPAEARRYAAEAELNVLRTDYCFVFPKAMCGLRSTEQWLHRFPVGAQYQVLSQKSLATMARPLVPVGIES